MRKRRLIRHLSMNPLVIMSVVVASAALVPMASADPAPALTAAENTTRMFSAPGKDLGADYTSSTDEIVQATGDAEGLHILSAREGDGFSFYEIARLKRKELSDVGPWTGYVCTTGSGNYAAAVYAPSVWSNKPGAYASGAFAAVIRLSDGKVTEIPDGVQLAYFSPGCGAGDDVAFTSSSATDTSDGRTTVISVDATTGSVSSRRTVDGFLTHVTPTGKGTVGVLSGNLVDLKDDGRAKLSARTLSKVPGPMFALAASANGAVDIGTVDGGKSVISRFDGEKFTELGRAPKGKVKLLRVAKGDAVVGDVKAIDTGKAPGLAKHAVDGRVAGISRLGHLVTHSVFSEQMKGVTEGVGSSLAKGAGSLTVKATALRTGTRATALVDADRKRPKSDRTLTMGPTAFAMSDDDDPLTCGEGAPETQCLSGDGAAVIGKIPRMETPCIVKRNDPKRQALQASANQVEWAVDQAVHGRLTLSRPADWHDTGLGAYTPQGLFPKPVLTGGGEIPAQVMLAILAQESNFKQASWHSMNGDSGNVTRSDWLGNGNGIHGYPDVTAADCGYGIAQVTTGMDAAYPDQLDALHAGAVTTDYAANIAAGLGILGEKWNQLKGLGMSANSGSAAYIENWYMALWGYNSGVYTVGSNAGLGFFNNPINPSYPADRDPFLRYSYDDASRPGEWNYPEKILGWAENPQRTWDNEESYVRPDMPLSVLKTPPYGTFCDASNACDPAAADPCPSWNNLCYWGKSAEWIGSQSSSNSSTENLRYSLGSSEPELRSKYDHGNCFDWPNGNSNAIVIDDLGEHEDTYDCGDFEGAWDGKFTLQSGDNFTMQRDDSTYRATPYIANIDLHQLGAGYDHHVYFTHSYPYGEIFHKVTGRWQINPKLLPSGDQPGNRYRVFVHLPSHGAEAAIGYDFIPGENTAGAEPDHCSINQKTRSGGQETWVEMGTFTFWKGGRIELDNIQKDATGDDNVVFDAVGFIPATSADPGICSLNDGGL